MRRWWRPVAWVVCGTAVVVGFAVSSGGRAQAEARCAHRSVRFDTPGRSAMAGELACRALRRLDGHHRG